MKTFTCKVLLVIFSSLIFSISAYAAESDAFKITIKTDNLGDSNSTSFTIPTEGSGYNYAVDCTSSGGFFPASISGNYTCRYDAPGTYTISIYNAFPRIYFNNSGDKLKILSVDQWGTQQWSSMQNAFMGCSNLHINATDTPDLSNVTSMHYMFTLASDMNESIGNWDVSHVTDMSGMFQGASAFDQNLGDWNVSNVTDTSEMFSAASVFNQDISNWNVSNVTNMRYMFQAAWAFNQNIGKWDVSKVTDMYAMFFAAQKFNQDIGTWDVSSVTDMHTMFGGGIAFNQDLGDWNVSNVTAMTNMFQDVTLSTSHYDNLLAAWSKLPLEHNINFHGGFSQYCDIGAQGRLLLTGTDNSWTITDNGKNCSFHISSSNAISVPNKQLSVTTITVTSSYGEGIVYSISGGTDSDLFIIDPVSGVLRFVQAPDYIHPTDKNGDNVYRVQVKAYDNGGEYEESVEDIQTIRVTVTPSNTVLVPIIHYLLL